MVIITCRFILINILCTILAHNCHPLFFNLVYKHDITDKINSKMKTVKEYFKNI